MRARENTSLLSIVWFRGFFIVRPDLDNRRADAAVSDTGPSRLSLS
jgi:hypothetical protein